MNRRDAQMDEYTRSSILNATPARLLTMLYDRLLLDLERARLAQESSDWGRAGEQLLHAQEIVAELQSSLNIEVWDGGRGLFALYGYVSVALINANVHRDVSLTNEAIELLEPLRQAWLEAASQQTAVSAGTWNVA